MSQPRRRRASRDRSAASAVAPRPFSKALEGDQGDTREAGLPVKDFPLPQECQQALQHLRSALHDGRGHLQAILEAIGLWTLPEEVYRGRRYLYLIAGEAFDWVTLAQRLCAEMDGLLPLEAETRIFQVRPGHPDFCEADFRRLLGPAKYQAFLNYWYGVTVEEALQATSEEEVYKERFSRALPRGRRDERDEALRRIYGQGLQALEAGFRQERGLPEGGLLDGSKEFTYWLFKLRLKRCEKERIASDTRKALEWLQWRREAL